VVGCGISGISVARVYLERGADIHILDAKKKEELLLKPAVIHQGVPEEWFSSAAITFWLDGETPPRDLRFDEVVVSPGVPWNNPLLNHCRSQGSIVRGELEWALIQIPGRIVIVTGSNGKTTTSLLLYHLLCSLGSRAFLVGNVGTPVSSLVAKDNGLIDSSDILVVESSSYQLEASSQFVPEVGLFLNISENHLERHGSLDGYINAKLGPFRRMKEGAQVVTSEDLEGLVRNTLRVVRPKISVFGNNRKLQLKGEDSWVDTEGRDQLTFCNGPTSMDISLEGSPLIGEHNRRNCAAALLGIQALGVPFEKSSVEHALRSFKMPSYRIQESGVFDGVTWINDSKSTTPEATRTAILSCLESYPAGALMLLLGGEMKHASWDGVWSLLVEKKHRISRVILFGASAKRLYDQISELLSKLNIEIQIFEISTLKEAIQSARKHAVSGEVVVFSPGCASFDEFCNFEDRGAFFDREAIIRGEV
jgi:UDP-N-acetylmuramoylalanine--D-glutamate ligase